METIKMLMSKEDADMLEKLFVYDDPTFTILGRTNEFSDKAGDLAEVEFYMNSTFSLWMLAKRVQLRQSHEQEMQFLREEIAKDKLEQSHEDRDEYTPGLPF